MVAGNFEIMLFGDITTINKYHVFGFKSAIIS